MTATQQHKLKIVEHSAEDLQRAIAGKAELYEAAIRNGYYLPKMKSSIITEQYITDVVCGKLFCPRYEEVRLKPCPRPPDKETLLKHVQNAANNRGKPTGIDEKHTPNKSWLLKFLSTYMPGLDIFKKSYVAPPRIEKIASNIKVELPEDFLADLPASRKKVKHRRLSMLSKGKDEAKAQRYKKMHEKFKREYLKMKNKVDAQRHSDSNRIEASSRLQSMPSTPPRSITSGVPQLSQVQQQQIS